ncbi:MAG: hypothetical protein RIS97_428 [Pseudomonadota bacterium]
MHGVLCHEDTEQAVPTLAYMVPTSLTAGFSELDAFASDSHCRLAIGRDYLDACPIRGIREGGLIEKLDVSVTVQTFKQ